MTPSSLSSGYVYVRVIKFFAPLNLFLNLVMHVACLINTTAQ